MKKRNLAMALAAVLMIGSVPVSAATFSDLNDTAWAAETITAVANKGLLSGYEDGTFRGKNGVTYCEATTMLYNLLTKTNNLQSIPTTTYAAYLPVFESYKIPQWAQYGITYALGAEIMSASELQKFMTNGTSNPATRQDVAILFGKALSEKYDIYAASNAKQYNDAYLIAESAKPYVDLLTNLGILSGSDNNNFNPNSTITRAEMAVILNKTYDILTSSTGDKGTITNIVNQGDGGYLVDVTMTSGEKKKLTLVEGNITVTTENGSSISINTLSKGDTVGLVFNGSLLSKIYLIGEGTTTQQKYDITGYILSIKDKSKVYLESENTGESETYILDNNCIYTLNGNSATKNEVIDAVQNAGNKYMYAGLMTRSETQKNDSGVRETVTYITSLSVSAEDTYTHTGQVSSVSDTSIAYKMSGSNSDRTASFDTGCQFYIGEKSATLKELQALAKTGTTYIKITIDIEGRAQKIIMSEDKFTDTQVSSTYTVKSFNQDKISVYRSGNLETYEFASTNDITFYIWDFDENTDGEQILGKGDWKKVSSKEAERYYDADYMTTTSGQELDSIYARINFNSAGKVAEIYLTNDQTAWSDVEESERKGTISDITNGMLSFKTSSTSYKLRNQYNNYDRETGTFQGEDDVDVVYPLTIEGAQTSSLTVLTRMANCSDVTLYAELTTNANNEITGITARLTEAKGKIVSYDYDEKELTIETSDGSQFNLCTTNKPKTDSELYTAEDLGTSGYIGSSVTLGFNSSGEVDKFFVTESTYNSGTKRIAGTVSLSGDDVKVSGSSKLYRVDSKTSVNSLSFNYTSIYTIKDMLADNALELYMEASVSDTDKIERMDILMKKASGTLQNVESGRVTIQTKSGNTFVFNTVSKQELAKGSGVDEFDSLINWKGKEVSLTFNSEGKVSEILP